MDITARPARERIIAMEVRKLELRQAASRRPAAQDAPLAPHGAAGRSHAADRALIRR